MSQNQPTAKTVASLLGNLFRHLLLNCIAFYFRDSCAPSRNGGSAPPRAPRTLVTPLTTVKAKSTDFSSASYTKLISDALSYSTTITRDHTVSTSTHLVKTQLMSQTCLYFPAAAIHRISSGTHFASHCRFKAY